MAIEEDVVFENTALTDDALDRRAALNAAVALTGSPNWLSHEHDESLLNRATAFYTWLRQRDTLKKNLSISAGTPVDRSSASPTGE